MNVERGGPLPMREAAETNKKEGVKLYKTDMGVLSECRSQDGYAAIAMGSREIGLGDGDGSDAEYLLEMAREKHLLSNGIDEVDGGRQALLIARTKNGAELVFALAKNELMTNRVPFQEIVDRIQNFATTLKEAENIIHIDQNKK